MTRPTVRSSALMLIITAAFLLSLPITAYTFGDAKAREGQCSDCHTLDVKESKEILKDLVKEVHAVELSEVPALYIVDATGKNGKRGLLYMDFSKNYVIAGSFISIADKKNVTQREITRLRRVDISTIPLTDSVVVGDPGAPTKLILFTDPQCPYCEKLHPELERLIKADPNVVFFIKMMPLVSIHPDSLRIAKAILCEGTVKYLEDSFAKRKVPDPTCKTDAVERTLKLAQDLGIGSTPTLILPDGRIFPGYRPAEAILELLKGK